MQTRWNLGGCFILITRFAYGGCKDEVGTAERRSEAEGLSERSVGVEQYGRRQRCGREAGNRQCSGHRELPASCGLLFAACYLRLVICGLLFAACYLRLVICGLLFAACYLRLVICGLLFA